MEDRQFITLEVEGGAPLKCEVVGVFPFEGREYVALIPPDRGGAAEILRYESDGTSYNIYSIEDDGEYDRATDEYQRLINGAD